MNDIFTARGSVLIAGATINGSTVDIAIDETGTIAGIGEGIRREYDADVVIDGSDRLAVPGLVNTHTHAAMTLLHAQEMLNEARNE